MWIKMVKSSIKHFALGTHRTHQWLWNKSTKDCNQPNTKWISWHTMGHFLNIKSTKKIGRTIYLTIFHSDWRYVLRHLGKSSNLAKKWRNFALNQSLRPVFGWLSGIQSVTTTNYILYQIFIGFFYTCNDGSNAFFCAVFVTRLCKKVIRCTISKMLSSILRTWWFLKVCVGANKRFSFYLVLM